MAPDVRIAVLLCDTPMPSVVAQHGDYSTIYTRFLHDGAKQLGDAAPGLSVSCYDVVDGVRYPSLEEVDGIVLTGSKHNSFEDPPWILRLVAFVREVLKQRRVRLVGVCFGHQIIARALDLPVGRSDRGWELSVVAVSLADEGRRFFGKDVLNIHQFHQDVAEGIPAGSFILGSTARCDNQGMCEPGRLLTVQGHPEFNASIMRAMLQKRFEAGLYDRATFDDAWARVERPHDGELVGAVFVRFIQEGL